MAGWAFTRPALVDDGALRADRVADGQAFAALTVPAALAVALAAWHLPVRRLLADRGGVVRGVLIGVCALVVLAGAIGLVAKVGNPFSWAHSQVSGGECANEPGRLTDLCANNRLAWWGESLDVARRPAARRLGRRHVRDRAAPLPRERDAGVRAAQRPAPGARRPGRRRPRPGLAVVGGAVVGVRRGLRQSPGADRAAAAALACLVLAFGVHALVDYDLDFLAVSAPMLVALGALLALGRPRAAIRAACRSSSLSEPRPWRPSSRSRSRRSRDAR